MSITVNGATNTLTAASGLTIAGNTAVTGNLSVSGTVTGNTRFGTVAAGNGIVDLNPASGTYVIDFINEAGSRIFAVDANGSQSIFSSTGLAVAGSFTSNASTGGVGAFSFLGQGTTTAYNIVNITNTGGNARFGVNNSTGGVLGTNTTAYSTVVGSYGNTPVEVVSNNALVASFTSTGLAVTGTLSATSRLTAKTSSVPYSGLVLQNYSGTARSLYAGVVDDSDVYFGSGYYYNAGFYRTEAATASLIRFDAGTFKVYTNSGLTPSADYTPTERFSISAAGLVSVTDTTDSSSTSTGALVVSGGVGIAKKTYCGDNIVMASGKGIDFSATSNGSGTTTSEVLSDYEEGTWTPAIGSGSGTITTVTATGSYVKVGRMVHATVNISITNAGTGAGALTFTVPFTSNVAGNSAAGSGVETAAVGFTGTCYLGTNSVTVSAYKDGFTTPIGTGNGLIYSIIYQTA